MLPNPLAQRLAFSAGSTAFERGLTRPNSVHRFWKAVSATVCEMAEVESFQKEFRLHALQLMQMQG